MIINWQIGRQRWAFRNLVSHFTKAMSGIHHSLNDSGDIDILLAPDQLQQRRFTEIPVIFHLDGNRWKEKK